MKPARISWKTPLLAATAGLVVGAGSRWISHRERAAEAGKADVSARVTVAPTARFIEGLAGADAGRCEKTFREMTADGVPAKQFELEAVFARWMELTKPREILAVLNASGISEQCWTQPFFEAWAAGDYAGAMAGTTGMRDFSGSRALAAIRRGDPEFLSEDLETREPDKLMTADALTALGRTDPQLAKRVATRRGSKPDQNAEIIAAVARGWADRDPAAALDWVKSLTLRNDNRAKALNAVLFAWMKFNPAGAAKAAEEGKVSTSGGVTWGDASTILRSPDSPLAQVYLLTRTDPFASVGDLYRQLSKSRVDWDKYQPITPATDPDGWFTTDPAKAAGEAVALPPGKARDFILSTICTQWAARSPAEATAFTEQHGLKPPYVMIEPSAKQLGTAPAETLAPLFSTEKIEAAERQQLTILSTEWSKSDPRAAAAWLVGQPESVSFDPGTDPDASTLLNNALGYHWAGIDAKGATRWAGNLPDGPRRNSAWRAMKFYVTNYAPDLAFTTSAKLVGDDRRMETLEADLRNVAEKIGLPAAREALDTVYLSAAERTGLVQFLEKPAPAAK